MYDKYFTSEDDATNASHLLSKELPTYRKAYSDRTAWIMSVMSELAYIKFNSLFPESGSTDFIKEHFIKKVNSLVGEEKSKIVTTLINKINYNPTVEKAKLESNLDEFQFKLLKTFDDKGTQAILVDAGTYIILSFRGTEADSLSDIKADAKANLAKCSVSEGQIHTGFRDSFNYIRRDVEEEINKEEYSNKPLFITGHSLGGALATVATKFLTHKGGIAACYTFGSPRVGNDDWVNNIKSPIHRIVNAADSVTMLPPGDVPISALSFCLRFIPSIGEPASKYLSEKFGRYMHAGNMRYLTNCKPGDFNDVRVLYSVSFTYRIKALIVKSLPFGKLLSDHSISNYSKKLMIIAINRNK
ncbi:lipase family protein [Colwellia psychrerythraea]|uniref:Lipase family protein n=1 Tax=Colwellia psychrerythraea (strain 34H / ATCC BAA-681) TaxID=167879 RepID=Q481Z4_COLP3|nr:lipase family protein [Colwellia psychrerythraea]AAZ27340.1 lipase family protein [Colwellia psychrerythraea 34H]